VLKGIANWCRQRRMASLTVQGKEEVSNCMWSHHNYCDPRRTDYRFGSVLFFEDLKLDSSHIMNENWSIWR
jgi:hypothetical protein